MTFFTYFYTVTKKIYSMNIPNFICPVTGKEFFIDTWKSKINSQTKQIEYFQTGNGWRTLVNPENGVPLVKSEEAQIQMTSVKTETASR